jgi:SAM-dependent methyltransferase
MNPARSSPPSDTADLYTGRAHYYQRGRPGYPTEVVEVLREEGVPQGGRIVDLGAGCGQLATLVSGAGYDVVALEPNRHMRKEASRVLPGRVVGASAEHLPLVNSCANAITVGQALHWFNPAEAVPEIRRVLSSGGILLAVWNERDLDSAFNVSLERLLRETVSNYALKSDCAPDPLQLMLPYAQDGNVVGREFPHHHVLSKPGLTARVMSTSWAPQPGTMEAITLAARLADLFDAHSTDEMIVMTYRTLVFVAVPVKGDPDADLQHARRALVDGPVGLTESSCTR